MKSFLVGSTSSAPTAGSTQVQPFVTNGALSSWAGSATADYTAPLPHAITLDRLRVTVATAPGTGKNFVFTVLKNGVATALTCTISGTNTSAQDLVDSVSFAAGDTITLQGALDIGGAAPGMQWWTARQDASGLTAILGSSSNSSLSKYAVMGRNSVTMTTADSGIIVPCGGTVENLYVSSAGATTVSLVKNGTVQTLAATGPTANDITHTFTVAAGDRISVVTTGTGSAASWGVSFAPTTDGQSFIGHIDNGHNTNSAATAYYQPLADGDQTWDATETNTYLQLQACTILAYYAETSVSPGTLPAAYTFTLRQNGSSTGAAVTINNSSSVPADNASGRAGNITGQNVTINDDDLIDIMGVPTGTPTGLHAYSSILIYVAPIVATALYAPLRIPNKFVGPMAMRYNFRQPYVPTRSSNTAAVVNLSAGLTFTGSTTKAPTKILSGVLTFTGSALRTVTHILTAATLNFTGSIARTPTKALSAGLSFTGSAAKAPTKPLLGTLSFTGALGPKSVSKAIVGALGFTGSLPKSVVHGLSAAVTFTGSTAKTVVHKLSGALSFTGSILVGRLKIITLSAALSFTGAIAKQSTKALSAGVSFTGSIKKSVAKTLNAGISFTGAVKKAVAHGVSATLSFSGNLVKSVIHKLSATLSFTGTVQTLKIHIINLVANLSFSGSTSKQTTKNLSGSVGFTGSIPSRQIYKSLAAGLNFTASLRRTVIHSLAGALSFTGNAGKAITKSLSANLSFLGVLATIVSHFRAIFIGSDTISQNDTTATISQNDAQVPSLSQLDQGQTLSQNDNGMTIDQNDTNRTVL